jgi:hypothetical protein
MTTYLIAHTCLNGKNAAQRQVSARTANAAVKQFEAAHPDRQVTQVGEVGKP